MMWLIMISPTELQLWGAFTMFGRLPRPCCQDALLLLESSFKREYSSEKKLERNEESYHQLVANPWTAGRLSGNMSGHFGSICNIGW